MPGVQTSDGRDGQEPDYRFTLANERTFLAYVRTSLAFLASGTAVLGFFDDIYGRAVVVTLGSGLYALGLFTAISSYRRWRSVERAIRRNEPLPSSIVPTVMAAALVVIGVIAFITALRL